MTRPFVTLFAAIIILASRDASADTLDTDLKRVGDKIIAIRHQIHANPELSNREFKTAELVATELRSLGLAVRTNVALTGVVGVLKGGRDGPVVAVRADMDALPVTEASDLPFRSKLRAEYLGDEVGVSHACGHDIHTAVQLGVAQVLAARREQLEGTVKFIFQPAEEGAPPGERGGAQLMLEDHVLEAPAPSAIFALHAMPELAVGTVGLTVGPIWASSDRFTVTLKGKQSHGAYPHLGVDPVVLAAQTILAFQTIPSRTLNPIEPAVVTVGTIEGGTRFNIIPGEVRLSGTVRAFNPEVQDIVETRMTEILTGLTMSTGASFDFDYQRITPFTLNHVQLTNWARGSLETALGASNVIDIERVMGAEDFAFFANEIPGFYFRLGVLKPGTESGGLHTPNFRADDSALAVGIRAMSQLVIDYLSAPPQIKSARPIRKPPLHGA